jgi:integrase
MSDGYKVRNLVFQSGERFPVLQNKKTGIPLFEPTLFVLNELRSLNRASATLLQATRAVMVALQVLDHLKIDLSARFNEGRVLELGEIEAFVRLCGFTQDAINQLDTPVAATVKPIKVVSLEKVRMRVRESHEEPVVSADTAVIRLMYIRDYVAWLARRKLLSLTSRHPMYIPLSTTSQLVVGMLSERIPSSNGRSSLGQRQGMTKAEIERLLEVIDPASPGNPWKNRHVRVRNQLIFHWLLSLGLRKSELLVIKLADIDLRSNEVTVPRRADDPEELRKDSPNTKTKDRLLSLGSTLADMTREYILGARKTVGNARRHPYFIVATGTGKPLTKSAVNKLFVELRRKVPGLPEELTPHVLRYTWNDAFSEQMDSMKVEPAEEERMRKQQMGWSDNSKMASHYTKRHTEKKAKEASLALQAKMHTKPEDKI